MSTSLRGNLTSSGPMDVGLTSTTVSGVAVSVGAAGTGTAFVPSVAYATAAYAIGISTGVVSTTSNKIAFATDTRSVLGLGMSVSRDNPAGFATVGVAGYAAGGGTSATYQSCDKWSAPSDTRSVLSGTLSTPRTNMAGMSDDGVAGYMAGGNLGGSPSTVTGAVEKMALPAETVTSLGTGLSTNCENAGAAGNPGVAGYVFGGLGRSGAAVTTVNVNNKFSFSSDTHSTSTIWNSAYQNTGMCNAGVAIYGKSINFTPYGTFVAKLLIPADTNVGAGNQLSVGRGESMAAGQNGSHGYIMGGRTSTTVYSSVVDKLLFSTDTGSALGTGLSKTGNRGTAFAI